MSGISSIGTGGSTSPNYYVRTLVERTPEYDCGLAVPNFTPRKAGQTTDTTGNGQKAREIDQLTSEQKTALRERLNYGQGDLTLQEWDDFLADLVDYGIISNDERMHANGLFREIPEEAQNGGTSCIISYGENSPMDEFDVMWTGDPLKWLDDMDLFMLKYEMYCNMDCKSTTGISNQRDTYKKVSQIIKDILG